MGGKEEGRKDVEGGKKKLTAQEEQTAVFSNTKIFWAEGKKKKNDLGGNLLMGGVIKSQIWYKEE